MNMFLSDAPKLQGPVAVYTWEGNQVNITCEVFAYPSAVISWFRDGQLLPSSNYSNIKIYNTPSASYLEVRISTEGRRDVQPGRLGAIKQFVSDVDEVQSLIRTPC